MNDANLKSDSGKVNINFNVSSLAAKRILKGPNAGQTLRGFYCKECGSGLFFKEDPNQKNKFTPQYDDRAVRLNSADQARFAQNLNAIADSDPFSIASFIKPRLYIIKNCKDCSCDSTTMIRSKNASVIELDPMSDGATNKDLSTAEFENACIIRPPVQHSCNVAPNENKGANASNFRKNYQALMNIGLVEASNLNTLVNKAASMCPQSTQTADDRIRDVMCQPKKDLPTENEIADCGGMISSGTIANEQ